MALWQICIIFGASMLAGAINSIAGGGTILTYPLLLSFGVLPITANATSSIGIIFGAGSSALGYRRYIRKIPRYYFLILIPCLAGGLIGAVLLKNTSDVLFSHIVPYFFLLAAVLIFVQPAIHKWLYEKHRIARKQKHDKLLVRIISALVLLFAVVYGGYFGIGFGIIMLAILGLSRLKNIHEINGLKNLCGIAINVVAVIYFIAYGLISWSLVPPLLLGNAIGGWLGARYSNKLPAHYVRVAIVFISVFFAVVLFLKPKL